MNTPGTPAPDGPALRRYLRDLAAVTALPAVWGDGDRRHIAESVAEVLVKILSLEFVYVRLGGPAGEDTVEAARTARGGDGPGLAGAIARALAPWLDGDPPDAAAFSLPHPLDGDLVQAALAPAGYGCEFGVLVAASGRREFPTEEDRLLLGVVANQAAVVLHRRRAEDASRESERRFRFLAESIPSVIWTAAADGTITYVNERWLEYTGLTPEQNARNWPELVLHPDDYQRCAERWTRALREGTEYEIEVRNRRRDGAYRWFVTRAVPLKDPAGRVLSWFGVTTDVHDLKEMQEQLREADRRKNEFLATLAHELRNPLAPVRNALQVLRLAGDSGATAEQAREMMERQVRQMVRLVDDLLDVSRITRGKVELRKERVDLARAVAAAVETSGPLIESRGHQLSVELPPEPVWLEADPTRLAQVLANLLNNAAKYTEKGGHIWLTAAREPGAVVVRVRDDGIGIPAGMLPRIFEMFLQVDGRSQSSQGGLGIGLTLVKSLVEMHGGAVEARSEGPGRGSEFAVRLPVPAEPARQAPQPGTTEEVPCPSRFGILVVDDNRDSAESMALILRFLGHDVRTAHDGQAAVEAAAEYRPDVVLLDIGLPKMNGYDAARRIREQPGGARPVLVAMTGWGQEEDRLRAKEAGFDHHLVKPVEPRALQDLLAGLAAAGRPPAHTRSATPDAAER
jgi:two-component system CheB/CheR fusion protein